MDVQVSVNRHAAVGLDDQTIGALLLAITTLTERPSIGIDSIVEEFTYRPGEPPTLRVTLRKND